MTASTQTYANPDGSSSAVTVGYTYTPAPPPPARTMFGTTPRGASTFAGVAAVDAVYGPGAAIRLYCAGSLMPPAVTDRAVIGSFKSMIGFGLATAAEYNRVFCMHEIDAKWKQTAESGRSAYLAAWKQAMGLLVPQVPKLGICLTADCFVNPGKDPESFLVDGVTHLGVDFDGINLAAGYHDYSRELDAAVAFAAAHGLTFGVPEFGANRAANDVDGAARAAWLTHWAGQFQAAGAEYVCVWEQDTQTGSTFTSAAEVATVRAMLALTP